MLWHLQGKQRHCPCRIRRTAGIFDGKTQCKRQRVDGAAVKGSGFFVSKDRVTGRVSVGGRHAWTEGSL